MPSDYPAFIFQDAIPAQQMMAHAQAVNEGMRIQELGKARQAEGMFRMAQLQQQQKAQREKTELDRMLAESQIAQAKIGNELRGKEIDQRGTLAREGFKADVDVAKIQAGRLDPREAINKERQRYDEELAKKEEVQDQVLIREWQILDKELTDLTSKKLAPLPNRSWYEFYDKGQDRGAKEQELKTIDPEITKKKQRQTLIENILAQRGKVPSPNRVVPSDSVMNSVPPPAYQLQPVAPADPMVDAIKRRIAEFIQAGGDPAVAYERAAKLGVDLR